MLIHVGCSLVCCALVCCSTLVCCALVCCARVVALLVALVLVNVCFFVVGLLELQRRGRSNVFDVLVAEALATVQPFSNQCPKRPRHGRTSRHAMERPASIGSMGCLVHRLRTIADPCLQSRQPGADGDCPVRGSINRGSIFTSSTDIRKRKLRKRKSNTSTTV